MAILAFDTLLAVTKSEEKKKLNKKKIGGKQKNWVGEEKKVLLLWIRLEKEDEDQNSHNRGKS